MIINEKICPRLIGTIVRIDLDVKRIIKEIRI